MTRSKAQLDYRARAIGMFIVDTKATMREARDFFEVGLGTVARDTRKLEHIDYDLYLKVQKQLTINRKLGQIKGGETTAKKRYGKVVNK